ncbi:MAG: hypothetical protein U0470_14130 [Anaerolineae bacterium]
MIQADAARRTVGGVGGGAGGGAPRRGVTVTTSLDGAVGRHGALAVAAALEPPPGACGLATGALLAADVGPDIVIEAGAAVVDSVRPGLGWDPRTSPATVSRRRPPERPRERRAVPPSVNPARFAVAFEGARMDAAELADRAANVAGALADRGVGPGDRVVACLGNGAAARSS